MENFEITIKKNPVSYTFHGKFNVSKIKGNLIWLTMEKLHEYINFQTELFL